MITVATWNVLHRVHAENWYEDVATRWPDEAERISAITARVAKLPARVIALQEVSGDQLAALRDALPGREFHVLRYPRIPRPRHHPTVLTDRTEYLVLVVDGQAREIAAESFERDGGKGALVIGTDELTVVATHVTGDSRRWEQLERLRALAAAQPGPVVLLGDFNIGRDSVAEQLGPGFGVYELSQDGPPTRPRSSGTKSQFIDHVVVRDAVVREAVVDSADGLSDHNPVRARLSRITA
ncbi:endonuclease/exonuclease/phosphatase family protein [Nocardia bovistercoris]|uniref:Endonuclease/exonuclease/phosphatase family protein n=1 Tax=Nocardia bovistercoris TaxID=2785916 RepID=A0A931I9I4_9NOCA|nr:endonuclease/exonuclease/phosphatase family protein [Nocardia bovistercoris]MBH0776831.1 endonuclease/exonuclease/phosphatase family protein [Nocardia bovistercoris]